MVWLRIKSTGADLTVGGNIPGATILQTVALLSKYQDQGTAMPVEHRELGFRLTVELLLEAKLTLAVQLLSILVTA